MSLKSIGPQRGGGEVLRSGLFKKLKTSRKKWFVLRAETSECSARLEYYDSEKKFNSGQPPKRSIPLKTCFNINKRQDIKHKHVIALYTKDDCFCVVLDTEEELETWLKALLSLQHGEDPTDGEAPRPTYEHVWQVVILNRGLGTGRTGNYRLCLTYKTLCLYKKDRDSSVTLNLSNIRSCGTLKNYFFLEIGRSSQLGAGELWMESEDNTIAQNIHTTVYHAMTHQRQHDKQNEKQNEPKPEEMRVRSSSATESSKPTNNSYRKQVVSGVPKTTTAPSVFSTQSGGVGSPGTTISHQRTQSLPLTDHPPPAAVAPLSTTSTTTTISSTITDNSFHPSSRVPITTTTTFNVNKGRSNQATKCRERCDSMPSRPRTTSEGNHQLTSWRPYLAPYRSHGRDISHSPPSGSPISPPSVGCSTDSAGSSYSLTDEADMYGECPDLGRYNSIPLTPDEAIVEEDCSEGQCGMYDSYVPMTLQSTDDGYVDMVPRYRHEIHSPTASVSSVVSGTPSTDIRFSDYPLDKVASYLTSEEDGTRTARAYSCGSKPETLKGKKHAEISADSARVRAFSVGSKTKKGPSRILSHQHHASLKSISAPILSNSRSHSSHSSNDPMDDLMEMDFSKASNNNHSGMDSGNRTITTNNGYVEMKPGVEIAPSHNSDVSPYVDMSGASSYMDMSGSSPSSRHEDECSSFVDINRQYRLPANNNYVDMDAGRKNRTKPSTSPAWTSDYCDMSGGMNHSRRSERGSSFSSQLSTSSSPRNNDYLSMNFSPQDNPKTPEGYVDMSLGKRHQRQGSLDGNQVNGGGNDDYLNMSIGPKKKVTKNQMVMSSPISIHPTTTSQATKHSSSPISISSLLSRKSSTGTSPKMHLPISSWTSSLPRNRARKDSKDSSSSSVTTPSSSSIIFPMSPSSPLKVIKPETPPLNPKPSASVLNSLYKTGTRQPSSDDYAIMGFDSGRNERDKENSDYVNYSAAVSNKIDSNPKKGSLFSTTSDYACMQSSSDYALMQPSSDYALMQPSTTTAEVTDRRESLDTSPLIGHLSLIGIKESQSMCFQPIKEDSGSSPVNKGGRKIDDSSDYMELSLSASSSECVSPAAKISRPNSVNSESAAKSNFLSRGNSDKSRPPSVSSDTSRSATSRPSSTSSELWSSSSTLVNSRPESVNSDRIEGNWTNNPSQKDAKPEEKTENKLHYASLDLITQDEESRSPRNTKGSQSSEEASSSVQGEPTFVYAEIDFVASEGLKQNSNSNQSLGNNNTKVKN
ncbi:insulin receptor substrate 1-B isoform X1 [Diabrotica virgifera virgifera]|uniref:Insulin receptor substrate 1 n=1 Tax=Diabrotica virgifera virgifera TaxID=50390 RepID=A0ABM5IKR5_DIAVI|nr:insulin receptor substrate 1-B isoform X1 [Diabrotica virgifera virgifera]